MGIFVIQRKSIRRNIDLRLLSYESAGFLGLFFGVGLLQSPQSIHNSIIQNMHAICSEVLVDRMLLQILRQLDLSFYAGDIPCSGIGSVHLEGFVVFGGGIGFVVILPNIHLLLLPLAAPLLRFQVLDIFVLVDDVEVVGGIPLHLNYLHPGG